MISKKFQKLLFEYRNSGSTYFEMSWNSNKKKQKLNTQIFEHQLQNDQWAMPKLVILIPAPFNLSNPLFHPAWYQDSETQNLHLLSW